MGLEANCSRHYCHAAIPTPFNVVLPVIARIENDRRLVDQCRVRETGTYGVNCSLERPQACARPGVTCHLAIVVSYDADGQSF